MSLSATPLDLQERAQDLVGRARVDVVGAEQHPALRAAAFLAHQVLHRGNGLLVGRGAGVEHVLRQLFAFVLHRVEEQAVQFLEHRQHRLARHRSPAAEHHGDLVLGQQLARLLREQRPVRGRVDHHRLELLAEHAALGVDLVDRHQRHVLEHGLADRHGAGQRVQHADLDGVGRTHRREPAQQAEPAGDREPPQRIPSYHSWSLVEMWQRSDGNGANGVPARSDRAVSRSRAGGMKPLFTNTLKLEIDALKVLGARDAARWWCTLVSRYPCRARYWCGGTTGSSIKCARCGAVEPDARRGRGAGSPRFRRNAAGPARRSGRDSGR